MAVVVELHNTGHVANQSEIVASIEHALHEEPEDWRISILGSRESDDWEMKIEGPRGFERRYTLAGQRRGTSTTSDPRRAPKACPGQTATPKVTMNASIQPSCKRFVNQGWERF